MKALIGLAVGLATFSLTPASAHAQCTMDNDCKGDRICVDGGCADPGPRPSTEKSAPAKPDARPDAPLERRSNGLFVGGMVLTITGGLMLTTGIVLLILGPADNNGGLFFAGAIVGGTGVLALPAGIPMLVIGNEKVPATKPAALDVAPWVSADSGGVVLRTTW